MFLSKIIAIIQGRMGSSRLPGKVLADVHGRPMVSWMLERIAASNLLDEIVFATTNSPVDDELVRWLKANSDVAIFRGSENDLVDRYYQCCAEFGGDIVVRITADDPLKDATIIDKAISMFVTDGRYDYVSNCIRPTYPEGLDIEVFSSPALERVWQEATLASDREHLTSYMINNPRRFSLGNFCYERDLSAWRWTVDKPKDLELIRHILGRFSHQPCVNFKTIVEYLDHHPELVSLNQGTVRMEGYKKSLMQEQHKDD